MASLILAYVNNPSSFKIVRKVNKREFVRTSQGGRLIYPEERASYQDKPPEED